MKKPARKLDLAAQAKQARIVADLTNEVAAERRMRAELAKQVADLMIEINATKVERNTARAQISSLVAAHQGELAERDSYMAEARSLAANVEQHKATIARLEYRLQCARDDVKARDATIVAQAALISDLLARIRNRERVDFEDRTVVYSGPDFPTSTFSSASAE